MKPCLGGLCIALLFGIGCDGIDLDNNSEPNDAAPADAAIASDGSDGGMERDAAAPFDIAATGRNAVLQFNVFQSLTAEGVSCDDTDSDWCFDRSNLDHLNAGPGSGSVVHRSDGRWMAVSTSALFQKIADAGNGIAYAVYALSGKCDDVEGTVLPSCPHITVGGQDVVGCRVGGTTYTQGEGQMWECVPGATAFQKGKKRAEQIVTRMRHSFRGAEAKWIVMNEIHSTFPSRQDYRDFIRGMAAYYHSVGKKGIFMYSQGCPRSGTNGVASADWIKITHPDFYGQYVACERFLNAPEMMAHGTGSSPARSAAAIAWAKDSYNTMQGGGVTTCWRTLGATRCIPWSHLFVQDNYDETKAGAIGGRAGVSQSNWHDAILGKSHAIHQSNWAGVVVYEWNHNSNRTPADTRNENIDLFTHMPLP